MSYVVIQDWMRKKLGLAGTKLIAYATIHGFSQAGQGMFTGSMNYLAEWAGVTRRGMQKAVHSLEDEGLIKRTETTVNGVTFPAYSTVTQFTGGELSSQGGANSVHGGCELSSPNKDRDKDRNKKIVKHEYGNFKNVLLTDDEYSKLKEKFSDLDNRIQKLSYYIESKGAKYKSHYATILAWARKDKDDSKREKRCQAAPEIPEWQGYPWEKQEQRTATSEEITEIIAQAS